MSTLNVGIIGAGNIASSYLKLAPQFKAIDVKAIADINIDAARGRADEFGVDADDVDGLLGRSDIDVVVNLTIPEAHFSVSKSVLEAGKHAYSEKPFVLTLEEGETLRSLAAANNLRVGSAPDTFLGGSHQKARELVDSGAVGMITAGTCFVLGHGMEHWHPNPDFFFKPGAGPVLDMGPYYVTNLIQMIGPVKRVAALSNSASETRIIKTAGPRQGEEITVETPTNVQALLHFENGATITFGASWDVWANRHHPMELYGTGGSLYVPDPNFFGGPLQHVTTENEVHDIAYSDHPLGVENEKHSDGMKANYRTAGLADMASAIAENRPHRCSLEVALHAVDVLTAILRSGESGEFVDLTTSCERPAWLSADEARALLA